MTVTVPQEYRRYIQPAERERLKTEWKEQYQCEVEVREVRKGHRTVVIRFEIYGPKPAVDQVEIEVKKWIHRPATKTATGLLYPKVTAFNKSAFAQGVLLDGREVFKKKFTEAMPAEWISIYNNLVRSLFWLVLRILTAPRSLLNGLRN